MTLEEFYAADERRRRSDKLVLGTEWSDGGWFGNLALLWIAATGELYLLRQPRRAPATEEGLLVQLVVSLVSRLKRDAWEVEVLGYFERRAALDAALAGWQEAIGRERNGVRWLRERVARAKS
jgi:hypothetical protein